MYPFERNVFDWLVVHVSRPVMGQRHMKAFVQPTAPRDQVTLNIYAAGAFEVAIGNAKQTLRAGQSSLDLGIGVIPAGMLVVERPLEPNSVRFCCQPLSEATRWTRTAMDVPAGGLVQTDGFIIPALPGLQVVKTFTAEAPTRVYVLERL